ncbi:uncharacterized protein Z519_01082 [Cladophialophora bantiana CBS 173.52]|uniref:BTB domain-containing protein n=1 Tax=Cladophialophora bantiana (strain ATCC 10958 / CBS 173.52 / CDC B-1940 / NIH 8579) TaxID=1442370 RepID=A0A0D2HVY9_CLAB1|nr:uncharacterized protein Z519_01082 [Cladophialophora bantiana CBS 173.52]KIW97498.1 hypothetical protein Z519_01082 [Cladophialophora bantiana CBS 173.52]
MASRSEPELVLVHPNGDLSLEVGNEPSIVEENENRVPNSNVDSETVQQEVKENRKPRILRIRVYSKFMTTSSPVFKAMLNESFREGQLPLSPAEPPNIGNTNWQDVDRCKEDWDRKRY